MAVDLDPRRYPYRKDLAALQVKGRVAAAAFVEGKPMQVAVPVLDLLGSKDGDALASQLLFGELVYVYETSGDICWVQNACDGYVGYVNSSGLNATSTTNKRVTSKFAHVYPQPSFKKMPTLILPYQSSVRALEESDDYLETPQGFINKRHVCGQTKDFVHEAARFLGTPYLWGGRSPFGVDCSGLVQLALMAVGRDCPRDSDMQMSELGRAVELDSPFDRGDLLFWKGHVGLVFDAHTLLHANAHHMATVLEPIDKAIRRIAETDGPVLAHKRL